MFGDYLKSSGYDSSFVFVCGFVVWFFFISLLKDKGIGFLSVVFSVVWVVLVDREILFFVLLFFCWDL